MGHQLMLFRSKRLQILCPKVTYVLPFVFTLQRLIDTCPAFLLVWPRTKKRLCRFTRSPDQEFITVEESSLYERSGTRCDLDKRSARSQRLEPEQQSQLNEARRNVLPSRAVKAHLSAHKQPRFHSGQGATDSCRSCQGLMLTASIRSPSAEIFDEKHNVKQIAKHEFGFRAAARRPLGTRRKLANKGEPSPKKAFPLIQNLVLCGTNILLLAWKRLRIIHRYLCAFEEKHASPTPTEQKSYVLAFLCVFLSHSKYKSEEQMFETGKPVANISHPGTSGSIQTVSIFRGQNIWKITKLAEVNAGRQSFQQMFFCPCSPSVSPFYPQ